MNNVETNYDLFILNTQVTKKKIKKIIDIKEQHFFLNVLLLINVIPNYFIIILMSIDCECDSTVFYLAQLFFS